jgi:hypothetical protein
LLCRGVASVLLEGLGAADAPGFAELRAVAGAVADQLGWRLALPAA